MNEVIVEWTDENGVRRRIVNTPNAEGSTYIRSDPRGPIGAFTIMRTTLLAIGDTNGARACSVLAQEAVDAAKRKVNWTNIRYASDPLNWYEADGRWHLKVTDKTRLGTDIDVDAMVEDAWEWVGQRKQQVGLDPKANVIGWRTQYSSRKMDYDEDGLEMPAKLRKRIDPAAWVPTVQQQKGVNVRNLVHHVHDQALMKWTEIEAAFGFEFGDNGKLLPLQQEVHTGLVGLLEQLLRATGAHVNAPILGWNEYRNGLRVKAGLKMFGQRMHAAMKKPEDARFAAIDEANAFLRLDLQTLAHEQGTDALVSIWKNELHHGEGNPSHAFRAILWEGSPVLTILGIERPTTCNYLDSKTIKKVVEVSMKQANPWEKLRDIMFRDTEARPGLRTHERNVFDEDGNPVWAHQCAHCKDTLQTALVREIRRKRTKGSDEALKAIVANLRDHLREERIGPGEEEESDIRHRDSFAGGQLFDEYGYPIQ